MQSINRTRLKYGPGHTWCSSITGNATYFYICMYIGRPCRVENFPSFNGTAFVNNRLWKMTVSPYRLGVLPPGTYCFKETLNLSWSSRRGCGGRVGINPSFIIRDAKRKGCKEGPRAKENRERRQTEESTRHVKPSKERRRRRRRRSAAAGSNR